MQALRIPPRPNVERHCTAKRWKVRMLHKVMKNVDCPTPSFNIHLLLSYNICPKHSVAQ